MITRGNSSMPCSEQGGGLKASGDPFQPMLLGNDERISKQVYATAEGQKILFWRSRRDSEGILEAIMNEQLEAQPGINDVAKSTAVLLSCIAWGLLQVSQC